MRFQWEITTHTLKWNSKEWNYDLWSVVATQLS